MAAVRWFGFIDEVDSTRAIFECIKTQDTDVDYIRYLVSIGARVNVTEDDWTPLHLACFLGKEDVVSALLDLKADVRATNFFNRTALHLACAVGKSLIVQKLLRHEAALRAAEDGQNLPLACTKTDVLGESPLHVAARDKGNLAIVRMLVQCGADVNVESRAPETPLNKSCFAGDVDVVRFLLLKGARMDTTRHPLIDAVREECRDVVKLLVRKGADVNVCRRDMGDSVLHMACRRRSPDIVKILVGNGAGVNAADREGCTPLHHAARSGNGEIVGILLDAGAQTYARENDGRTPLDLALQEEHHHLVQTLQLPKKG